MGNVFVATIMWKQMVNICTFVCLNFCPNSSYTGEIILRHWGAGDLLSVSDGDVASVFKNCIFLHICCLYIWVSGGCEELYPHVTAGERERERQCSKLLSSFWMWKENYICVPSGRRRAGCRRACVLLLLQEHFAESLQMQGSSGAYCRDPSRATHSQTWGKCAALSRTPVNACCS